MRVANDARHSSRLKHPGKVRNGASLCENA